MTLADSMGASKIITGGAILSGIYFGDRWSPMSTSALLVSSITQTDIFVNLKGMARRSLVPLILTLLIYGGLGVMIDTATVDSLSVTAIFAENYVLELWTTIPAIIVLVLSIWRINVKKTLIASCLAGIGCCIWGQNMPLSDSLMICLTGFRPESNELARLMSGGGVLSMLNVFAIVMISSSYAGMFQGTNFLDGIQQRIMAFSQRTSVFFTILVTSLLTGAIACNQTLTILLTHQLCEKLAITKQKLALDLEDTAVVIAPLIPWGIAGAVPLAIIDAPASSLLLASYLYFLPLWQLLKSNKRA